MTAVENKKQGAVISAWEYAYHVDGNLSHKIDKSSAKPVTTSYRYDRLGRLIEEDDAGWKRATYEYDAYSNRIRMTVEGKTKGETFAVTTYHYSLNNLLEKEIKKQGKTTETYQYRYDDNGNETFRIWEKTAPSPDYPGEVSLSGNRWRKDPTVYEWRQYNGFNQLIRMFQDDGEIAYQYRGDGMRHHREVSLLTESQEKTTVYYWDGTDIVAEQTVGEGINCYLRGLNLVARQMDGMLYYYLFNGHGDVTQLRDQYGNRVTSYEYDAFGSEKDLWEEDLNPFRYCGEYYDLSSSTYYLRNRNYRPATGRFLTEDTHWNTHNMIYGNNNNSMPDINAIRQSSNLYVYCMNNPILFIDPSGLANKLVVVGLRGEGGSHDQGGNFNLAAQTYRKEQEALGHTVKIIDAEYLITNTENTVANPPSGSFAFAASLKPMDYLESSMRSSYGSEGIDEFAYFGHSSNTGLSVFFGADPTLYEERWIVEDTFKNVKINAGANMYFNGCNAGTGDNSVAQQISNFTGASVYAFTSYSLATTDKNRVNINKRVTQSELDVNLSKAKNLYYYGQNGKGYKEFKPNR